MPLESIKDSPSSQYPFSGLLSSNSSLSTWKSILIPIKWEKPSDCILISDEEWF